MVFINKLNSKKIFIGIWVIIILLTTGMLSTSLYKKHVRYMNAKTEILKYIEQYYGNVLNLGDIHYNNKMEAYVGNVTDKDDSSCKSYIAYNPNAGHIEDDYYFRTIVRMEDQLRAKLVPLISASSGISSEDFHVSPILEIPKFKYRMFSSYSSEEPVKVSLDIYRRYKNKDDFEIVVFEILSGLYNSGLSFNEIEIYAPTLDDGNKSYVFTLSKGRNISTPEDVKDMVAIKTWKK